MKKIFAITTTLSFLCCNACSHIIHRHAPLEPVAVEVPANPIPGTVTQEWHEPMYDTVRVPAQLDPTGTYFRPSHQTVVEIRPDRYQEQQFPADERSQGHQ